MYEKKAKNGNLCHRTSTAIADIAEDRKAQETTGKRTPQEAQSFSRTEDRLLQRVVEILHLLDKEGRSGEWPRPLVGQSTFGDVRFEPVAQPKPPETRQRRGAPLSAWQLENLMIRPEDVARQPVGN